MIWQLFTEWLVSVKRHLAPELEKEGKTQKKNSYLQKGQSYTRTHSAEHRPAVLRHRKPPTALPLGQLLRSSVFPYKAEGEWKGNRIKRGRARCEVQVRDRCTAHSGWGLPAEGARPRHHAIYSSTRQQFPPSKLGFKVKLWCAFYKCYFKNVKCPES